MTDVRRLPRPALAVACVVLAIVCLLLVPTSPIASTLVRAATAVAAAALLLWRARTRDAFRRPRRLLAAGLLVGGLSAAALAVVVVTTGRPIAPGSRLQLLELVYAPFAVAGVLALPARRGGRLGALADGVMAASALWYLALQVLTRMTQGRTGGPVIVSMSYALVGAFTLAAVVSAHPRVEPAARTFLLRGGAGLTAILVSDVAYAVATQRGTYVPTSWIAQLYEVGLLLLVLTATTSLTPSRPTTRARSMASTLLSEVVLPYAPMAVAVGWATWTFVEGGSLSHDDMLPTLVIGVAMLVRHTTAVRDYRLVVSDLERSERTARAETLVDPLTGLANRRGLLEFLGAALADVRAHPVAIAMVDLNDFKDVNDTHGHATGDQLLQACARRLVETLPPGGIVARLGGDEFAICQKAVSAGGEELADAVVAAFAEPFSVGRRPFTVRPSVGVVLDERSPGRAEARDSEHLLAHADVAMYQAKAEKDLRHAPAVVLTGAERVRAASVIRLREEITTPDLSEFAVVYQPVVDLRSGVLRGVEALLRWRHPDLGEISPAQFIPWAEQVGAMGRLGEHVLEVTTAQVQAWSLVAPDVRLGVGVNLSPRQISDPKLLHKVLEVVQRNGLLPDQLVLEITESALMEDLDSAAQVVSDLRAAGVSVAIDDYGTGYSSLGYLRRFEADVLKIDREFVGPLVDDPRTAVLVRSVVDLAERLDLQTIAEGIETVEQLQACRAQGCELGQGYLFSRPVEASAITEMLLAGRVFDVHPDAVPAGHLAG